MNIVVDGQMLNYQDTGSGDLVVLLHGWGANLQSFDMLAKQLSAHYRVIRIDFPGFGGSTKPDDSWDVSAYAQLVQKFLQKRECTPYALIGHSFGGRVILKAVGSGYITPDRIVLLGSAGVKPSVTMKQMAFKATAKAGKQITKFPGLGRMQAKLHRKLYESAGSTDYLDAEEMRPIFLNTINEDLQADAAKITQPGLLIYGENDTATPPSDGETLHAAIKQSDFVVIPDAGHFVYLDQPSEVTKRIEEFLR